MTIEKSRIRNPRIAHLRVKIKNLAQESALIKKEEARALGLCSPMWRRGRDADGKPINRSRPPVKDRPRFHLSDYRRLRKHRIKDIREYARENLLAYAALRGRAYVEVEQKSDNEPNWKSVEKIISKFRVNSKEEIERLSIWIEAAKNRFE